MFSASGEDGKLSVAVFCSAGVLVSIACLSSASGNYIWSLCKPILTLTVLILPLDSIVFVCSVS